MDSDAVLWLGTISSLDYACANEWFATFDASGECIERARIVPGANISAKWKFERPHPLRPGDDFPYLLPGVEVDPALLAQIRAAWEYY